jgi:hypothetical protein
MYEKAYTNRDARIRQKDLLQRFLLGIGNDKAMIHIELNKDPKTIEEAVHSLSCLLISSITLDPACLVVLYDSKSIFELVY